jgi:replicative DNA helicase
MITQYAARLSHSLPIIDEFEAGAGMYDTSASSLRRRLAEVSHWSRDSAFMFGIACLDDITGGVQPGEMMALSGAQGSMKTSLLLSGRENALDRGMSVQFFSLDMTPGEIQERRIQRRLHCHQAVLHRMIRDGDRAVRDVEREINGIDYRLFDLHGNDGQSWDWNIDEIAEQVRIKMPNVLCIDYLTLLRRREQSDLDCVNETMPKLKRLAQNFGIRVIILSQMGRASKREQSAGVIGGHGKGGGIIEELVHSEIELFKDYADGMDSAPIIASVTKNRRGPSGRSYRLDYESACMLFTGRYARVERASKAAKRQVFESGSIISPAMVDEDDDGGRKGVYSRKDGYR